MQSIYSSAGVLLQEIFAAGYTFLSRTIITTTGSSTYTPPTLARVILVECIAGGAGGQAGTSGAGSIATGGGGGGGGYSADIVFLNLRTFTAVVNAGGGSAANGGPTSFSSSNPTITYVSAEGGGIGSALASNNTEAMTPGGSGGAVTSANAIGRILLAGNNGFHCHRVSGTVGRSGAGAPGPWGGGPPGRQTQGAGAAGGNYGSGGAAGFSINGGGAAAGGHGGQGVIIVTEFA